MNARQLYEAIGQADAAFLEHSERTASQQHRTRLRVGLLAAALAAALSITVAASPAVRQWIFGQGGLGEEQVRRAALVEGENSYLISSSTLAITPDLTLKADAPETIETFYVPLYLAEHWIPGPNYVSGDKDSYLDSLHQQTYLVWNASTASPAQLPDCVLFQQFTGQYQKTGAPLCYCSLGYGNDYSIDAIDLSGMELLRLTVPPSELVSADGSGAYDPGHRVYFWTDGNYVFSLQVNPELPEQTVADIVNSLAPVEDLTDYMQIEWEEAGTPFVLGDDADHTPLNTLLVPSWLPESCTPVFDTVTEDRVLHSMLWALPGQSDDGGTVLELIQSTDPLYDAEIRADWQTQMAEYQVAPCQIGDAAATLYTRNDAVQLVWRTDDGFISLCSRGVGRLSVETLLQIAEALVPTGLATP